MATFAPSVARRLAIAAPIPREPPVISAIFPSSFLFMVLPPISFDFFSYYVSTGIKLDLDKAAVKWFIYLSV
jgi:hypothetical protein